MRTIRKGIVAAASIASLALSGLLLAGPASADTAADIQPFTATGCTLNAGLQPYVCITVNGKGLHVNYATVTNESAPKGRAYISDTSDPHTFTGPILGPGEAWRQDFNRNLKNNSKVCGSIAGLGVACVKIHK